MLNLSKLTLFGVWDRTQSLLRNCKRNNFRPLNLNNIHFATRQCTYHIQIPPNQFRPLLTSPQSSFFTSNHYWWQIEHVWNIFVWSTRCVLKRFTSLLHWPSCTIPNFQFSWIWEYNQDYEMIAERLNGLNWVLFPHIERIQMRTPNSQDY